MGQSAKAALVAAACFALPWLFSAWLFWKTCTLPFPWSVFVSWIAAALVGYLLYRDRDKCLERFYRKREPEKTSASQSASPDLKLQGLYRLLVLYMLLALTWTIGYALAASYLRGHSHITPVAWAPFSRFLAGFIEGTPTTAANDLAIAAAALASAVGFLTYAAGRVYLFPDQGPVLRGRRVGSGKEARRELSRYREPGEPEIAWGGLKLPWSAGVRHFLAAGTTGSGKTNLLLQFMASVLVWIGRKPDQRALVYDPKTELLSFLYGLGLGQKVRILHPLDVRSSAWDLSADVTSAAAAQQMAAVLIPQEKESKNPYFSMAAQQLLAGVFTFLMKTVPGKWDLRDVILIMERRELLRQALERYPETAALVEEYFEPEETFANVRSTVANWMRRYRPIAACWHHAKDKVSLEDWIAGDYILLLGQDDSIRVQMDAINRALFLRASQLILRGRDSSTRRSWLIIDEVRELGNLDGLSRFLTTARSKGACFCGGYQTPSGMKAAVGEHVADEINDQIWNWALCRMGGDVSAEWASRLVGDVEFDEDTQGTGPKVVRRRALMPETFKELPQPTPQTGVSAVFITPYTGAYTYTVPGREITAVRRLTRDDVPNLVPRPKSQQELPPWSEADYRRLGLRPVDADREEAPRARLGVVRENRRHR
jgi:hypothetical protein